VLAASILLLEWHYLVDLLGGVAVAVLAVLVVDHPRLWSSSEGKLAFRMPSP